MFVVYSGADEVLVTTRKREDKAIRDYFTEGGRVVEDYDRTEVSDDAVQILTSMIVI